MIINFDLTAIWLILFEWLYSCGRLLSARKFYYGMVQKIKGRDTDCDQA